jgi:hypothetical protein
MVHTHGHVVVTFELIATVAMPHVATLVQKYTIKRAGPKDMAYECLSRFGCRTLYKDNVIVSMTSAVRKATKRP